MKASLVRIYNADIIRSEFIICMVNTEFVELKLIVSSNYKSGIRTRLSKKSEEFFQSYQIVTPVKLPTPKSPEGDFKPPL